jgi:hypothetical protein
MRSSARWWLPATVFAAALISSCQTELPQNPVSVEPSFAGGPLSTPAIEVTVTSNGAPVTQPYLVVASNTLTGPFRSDGSLIMGQTINGYIALENLPIGFYCVYVRQIATNDATANGGFLVPAFAYNPAQSGADVAVLHTGRNASAPVTKDTYSQFCLSQPIIELKNASAKESITVPLIAGTSTASATYVNPDNTAAQIGAWGVLDLSGLTIPWMPPIFPLNGVKPGFLTATAAAQNNGAITLQGLNPNVPVVLESAIPNNGRFGELTATTFFTTALSGQTNLGTIILEPLICNVQRDGETVGDNNFPNIDFGDPIKAGWRATFGVPLTPRNEVAIFYPQTGFGSAKLQMRFTTATGELALQADYSWNGTTGTLDRLLGTAIAAGVTVDVGFVPLPGSLGNVRVTWVVNNIPTSVLRVEYKLNTNGDQAPDAARFNTSRGFSEIRFIPTCTPAQGSNDDEWWLPG